jgi:hypothetical protein
MKKKTQNIVFILCLEKMKRKYFVYSVLRKKEKEKTNIVFNLCLERMKMRTLSSFCASKE